MLDHPGLRALERFGGPHRPALEHLRHREHEAEEGDTDPEGGVGASTMSEGISSTTTRSWVSSMPRLKPNSVVTSDPPSKPRFLERDANASPWTRPKPAAMRASPRATSGRMALIPETAIEKGDQRLLRPRRQLDHADRGPSTPW